MIAGEIQPSFWKESPIHPHKVSTAHTEEYVCTFMHMYVHACRYMCMYVRYTLLFNVQWDLSIEGTFGP